jgi:copper chaperone CopZ
MKSAKRNYLRQHVSSIRHLKANYLLMKNSILFVVLFAVMVACAPKQSPKTEVKPVVVEAKLRVEGMHCTDCENSIAKGVTQLAGIDSIKANYLDSTAFVRFDSNKTTVAEISKAIEERGYHVVAAK